MSLSILLSSSHQMGEGHLTFSHLWSFDSCSLVRGENGQSRTCCPEILMDKILVNPFFPFVIFVPRPNFLLLLWPPSNLKFFSLCLVCLVSKLATGGKRRSLSLYGVVSSKIPTDCRHKTVMNVIQTNWADNLHTFLPFNSYCTTRRSSNECRTQSQIKKDNAEFKNVPWSCQQQLVFCCSFSRFVHQMAFGCCCAVKSLKFISLQNAKTTVPDRANETNAWLLHNTSCPSGTFQTFCYYRVRDPIPNQVRGSNFPSCVQLPFDLFGWILGLRLMHIWFTINFGIPLLKPLENVF